MLSRTIRRSIASPFLRGAAPIASRPSIRNVIRPSSIVSPSRRQVTTDAASSSADPENVPQDDDTPFEVRLSDEAFETYELDPPPYTLEVTKAELKKMYYDMVAVRYESPAHAMRRL
jgi:pyruvate dehydrogenase E1 component alpha subunit